MTKAAQQEDVLWTGLEQIFDLICRLSAARCLYWSKSSFATLKFDNSYDVENRFGSNLVKLYARILEFHARALCHLHKPRIAKFVHDVFTVSSWTAMLKDIEELESQIMKYLKLFDSSKLNEVYEQSGRLANIMTNGDIKRETAARREERSKVLQTLYTCSYADHKNRNDNRTAGTCEWFTAHPVFRDWIDQRESRLLLASADPGCGKSVLARYLIDSVLPSDGRVVCYFFFKDGLEDQQQICNAICLLIHQIIVLKPELLHQSLVQKLESQGSHFCKSFTSLWTEFCSICALNQGDELIFVLDALDECQEAGRWQLIQALRELYHGSAFNAPIKILITSRPYDTDLRRVISDKSDLPFIHLSGDDEVEATQIAQEIGLVIKARVRKISDELRLEAEETIFLTEAFLKIENRTYLWVTLTLDVVRNFSGFSRGNVRRCIETLPGDVNQAYEKILGRSTNKAKAKLLLRVILAASRPLLLSELSLLLAVWEAFEFGEDFVAPEPDFRFKKPLRDICGLFLTVIDSKVYFLHRTAREFLAGKANGGACQLDSDILSSGWRNSFRPMDSHKRLARLCLGFLELYNLRQCEGSFVKYAIENWPSHFTAMDHEIQAANAALLLSVFQESSCASKTWDDNFKESKDMPAAEPLRIAAYFGLEPVVRSLLGNEHSPELQDSKGRTPLMYAAGQGHMAVANLFILHGAKINFCSNEFEKDCKYGSWSVLSWSVRHNREDIVSMLLENEADPNLQGLCSYSALQAAALASARKRGDLSTRIAEMLLARGANVNRKPSKG